MEREKLPLEIVFQSLPVLSIFSVIFFPLKNGVIENIYAKWKQMFKKLKEKMQGKCRKAQLSNPSISLGHCTGLYSSCKLIVQ